MTRCRRPVVACLSTALLLFVGGCRSGSSSSAVRDGGAETPPPDLATNADTGVEPPDAGTEMPDGVAEASSPDATMDASNPRDGSSPDAASDAHDGGAPDGGGDAATGGDTKGDAAAPASLVWRALTVPGIEPESITALWGSGPIELYVGTSKGKVIHRNAAGTWSSQALPGGVPP